MFARKSLLLFQLTSFSNATGTTGKEITFTLADLTGRQLRADRPGRMADGPNVYSMDVTGVQPGMYFVTASNAAMEPVTKVIITRLT